MIALEPPTRPDLGVAALSVGVAAAVSMDVSADQLLETLERVAARQTIHACAGVDTRSSLRGPDRLTTRELEVLELIAAGLMNKEIAQQLWLSVNSVKTYIRTAYRKIGVTRRSEAVVWAVQHGLAHRVAHETDPTSRERTEPTPPGADREAAAAARPLRVFPRRSQ